MRSAKTRWGKKDRLSMTSWLPMSSRGACESYLASGTEALEAADYETAIGDLGKVVRMDAGYNEGTGRSMNWRVHTGIMVTVRMRQSISSRLWTDTAILNMPKMHSRVWMKLPDHRHRNGEGREQYG